MIQRYPGGFYILGAELRDTEHGNAIARQWSLQGLRMFEPGEQYEFSTVIQNPIEG